MNDNDKPLVTFALFAYNQEEYIREAIEGAFSQTYEPLEIILSDDCSTDRTLEIMLEMAAAYVGRHEVKVRRSKVNLGLAGHINEILEDAKGEFVCWAAGDDISMPHRTTTLVLPMLDNLNIIGTHSTVQEIDLVGNLGKIRQHGEDTIKLSIDTILASGRGVVSQAHAFRKSVFDVFGPLSKSLTNEGPAMAFRECLLGKVIHIPEATVFYRIGSGVSNYRGKDLLRIKKHEPEKICIWRLSASEQMLDDARKTPHLVNSLQISRLKKNIYFYNNLLNINRRNFLFWNVVKNFIAAPSDPKSLRAAIRTLLPCSVFKGIKL